MLKNFILLIILILPAYAQNPKSETPGPEEVVRGMFHAFNNHDVDELIKYLHDDVKWMNIVDDSINIEIAGKENLYHSTKEYFESVPTVRSEIEELFVTGNYVSFREKVFFQGKYGEKSQASLSVYEVEGDKIIRVWYYPSVKF